MPFRVDSVEQKAHTVRQQKERCFMPAKRNKPRLAVTVDKDVYDWVVEQARIKHLPVAQFVNQILWESYEGKPIQKQPTPSAAVGVHVAGNGGRKCRLDGQTGATSKAS